MTRTILRRLAACSAALLMSATPLLPTPMTGTPAAQAAPTAPTYVGKVRWAYYVPYAGDSLESLKQNIRTLTHVSPYWYQINGQGELVGGETKTNAAERGTVIDLARRNGVKVLPMVKNNDQYEAFTPALADAATRAKAVEGIVRMVVDGNFEGVNIDFEGISADDRPMLTQFMADLAPQMRAKGKIVSQAMAAKDGERTTGWAGEIGRAHI